MSAGPSRWDNAVHQVISIDSSLLPTLRDMFDNLGEPAQVLSVDSDRPLVLHSQMGQVTLVTSGYGYISLDGIERPIRVGSLAVLSKGCPHAFYTPGHLELRHWHWPQALLSLDRTIVQDRYEFSVPSEERQE
jgi:hypothetical protein